MSTLPPDAQGPISAALGKDNAGYWVAGRADGFRGENPRHALVAEFTREGVEVRSHNLRWGMEIRGYGYGDALLPLKTVAPKVNANRVEYRRGGLTEWYENGPLGLEQGFNLAYRPGKANGQPLTLELALRGELVSSLEQGGRALALKRKEGGAVLRYTGLHAWDQTGRELRSWLEVRDERLRVRVDDRGARYPVVVDPWFQQAELTVSDGATGDEFGHSVALNGSTVVVGAPYHTTAGSNQHQGAAYVFVQNGATWNLQAELKAPDGAALDCFGCSVAVSGGTAVVGASSHTVGSNLIQGAAYVFVQNGTTWSLQAELSASDGAAYDEFGDSVAVSGSTVLVGAPGLVGESLSKGKAYVFAQNGTTWSQQAELTASDGAADDLFGISVALDHSTAVIGATDHFVGSNFRQGAAYVFVQNGTTWNQQAELTASDGAATDEFGLSVAISGSTAVIGPTAHFVGSNFTQGVAYVFVGNGGTWSQQAELTASDGAAGDCFGCSVAVMGGTAIVGARSHTFGSKNNQGAVYVFGQSGGTWTQQTELTASDGGAPDNFGMSVAISDNTAVVGAPLHTVASSQQGAAYVFGLSTISFSPTYLNFGKQIFNETSVTQTVKVGNSGSGTLNISSITVSGDFAISANTCGSMLAVGEECFVGVTFTPTQLGARTGTLSFVDDAPKSPQTVPLLGTGIPPVALNRARVNFGKVKVGTTSVPRSFTMTNNQTVTLTGIVISTTGDFAVSSTTCGSTLGPKKKCAIRVTFTPTQTGTRTGQLQVHDSANNSPQTADLKGTGT